MGSKEGRNSRTRTMGVAAPATPALRLPQELVDYVERLARAQRVPHRLVRRAAILKMAAAGRSTYAIARDLGCSESTVRKWRGRVAEDQRASAIEDAPRSGRPARIGLNERLAVLRLACDVPPDEFGRRRFRDVWTLDSLRKAAVAETGVHICRSEIGAILRCGGLSPHRVVGWLHSTDPTFKDRSKRVAQLYVAPPPNTHVLCVDEKTGIQALRRIHPNHVDRRGRIRREFEYGRCGTTTMIAALDVATGEVHAACRRRTRANFLDFLDAVVTRYPTGKIVIVLDNLNIHTGPKVATWLRKHGGRVRVVYTPKHASWLNQIELWFSILQRRILRFGSFESVVDLERRLYAFVAYYNRFEAKPFRWRFRGDFRPPKVRPDRLLRLAA